MLSTGVRVRRLLCLSVVLVGLTLGLSPAASATDTLTTTDGVLYYGCRDHAYGFSFALPPGTDEWSVDVAAVGPDGTTEASDSDFGPGASANGAGSLEFCGSESAGAYELRATVEYTDSAIGGADGTFLTVVPFTMREPRSLSSLSVSDRTPALNQIIKFVLKTRDERPEGFLPTLYSDVHLEARIAGSWVIVKASRTTTNEVGTAVLRYRWKSRRPVRIRAVTETSSGWSGSISAPLRVG